MNTFNTRDTTVDDAPARLLDAAERLLRAGRKPDALTSREIASEAGLSPGLVNYHFDSKSALIAKALVQRLPITSWLHVSLDGRFWEKMDEVLGGPARE